MRIEEAKANIGSVVRYHPQFAKPTNYGIIRAVGDIFVFVQFDGDISARAIPAANLTLAPNK